MCCARPTSPHLETGTRSFERCHLDFARAEMAVGSSSSLPAHLLKTFRAQGNRDCCGSIPVGSCGCCQGRCQPHVRVQVSHAAPQPSLLPLFTHVPATCPHGCSEHRGLTLSPMGQDLGNLLQALVLFSWYSISYLGIFLTAHGLCPGSAAPHTAMKHPSLLLPCFPAPMG